MTAHTVWPTGTRVRVTDRFRGHTWHKGRTGTLIDTNDDIWDYRIRLDGDDEHVTPLVVHCWEIERCD